MPKRACLGLIACLSALLPGGARAQQEFPEQQRIVGDVLFAARTREARLDALERRRAQAAARAAAQRAAQQAALLEAQAGEVRALRGELQALRDEREVLAAAEAFDAALAARDWAAARAILADTVTVELWGPGVRTVAADALVAEWAAARGGRAGAASRSGGRVTTQGDRATLAWSGRPGVWGRFEDQPAAGRPGGYEYRFVRTGAGWRLDGLDMQPRPEASGNG